MNSNQIFALFIITLFTVVVPVGLIFFIPAAKGMWQKVSNQEQASPDDIEELRGRVQELEERLDFTERVLSQVRGQNRIESVDTPV
jgi:hypothetical protein